MEDRYAGDIGDFIKLGLLRALTKAQPSRRLGVNWYLVDDESHNDDGRHVAYLNPSNTHHASLAACDGELMTQLANVVATTRSVASLEGSGALPPNALTYSTRLDDSSGPPDRSAWHAEALAHLAEAEIVFVDPDNGIRGRTSGNRPRKYAFLAEMADYVERGQSLVIYHHADRTAPVHAQAARRMAQLEAATGVAPLGAVVARRSSTRFFFILPSQAHREELAESVADFSARWTPHVDWVPYELAVSEPMVENVMITPTAPTLLSGAERFIGLDASVTDFWAYAVRDLRTNTTRGLLAEWLVARAVGANEIQPEWAAFDVLSPRGVRIEVKTSAYLQSWAQTRLSPIRFGNLRTRKWDPVSGEDSEPSFGADVYVFGVQTATDHALYDPLDVSQWDFYVLPVAIVTAIDQKSLGLPRVQQHASPVDFGGLAAAIADATSLS